MAPDPLDPAARAHEVEMRAAHGMPALDPAAVEAAATKVCSRCGVEKPRSEFHKNSALADGLKAACKACRNSAHSAYMLRMSEGAPATDGSQRCSWCGETKSLDDFHLDRTRLNGHKSQCKACVGLRKATTPSRHRPAHTAVQNAVRRGVLVRPDACEKCDRPSHRLEAHHDDYERPLDVRWLCPDCHKLHHRDLRRAAA